MSRYLGDFRPGQSVRAEFNSKNTSATPTTLATPSIVIARDGAVVNPTGGVALVADADSVTGLNRLTIDTSIDTTTFAAGFDYRARLGGTSSVGGVSVVGDIVAEWSIANRSVAVDASGRVDVGKVFGVAATPYQGTLAAVSATTATLAASDAAAYRDNAGAGITTADGKIGIVASSDTATRVQTLTTSSPAGWIGGTPGSNQGYNLTGGASSGAAPGQLSIVYGTVALGSTGASVILSGLPPGKSFAGQHLVQVATAEVRQIANSTPSGSNYVLTFTGPSGSESGPFSAVTTGEAMWPTP